MHAGMNRMKTWILIAALGGLFVLIGGAIGGTSGAVIALGFALVFNFSMYWFSDKIAIATTRSKPATEQDYPQLYRIVRELAQLEQMPMPAIYVSDMMQPNAFATGRSPQHASVAVTKGILQILDDRELRGVLAHELSHVRNRDILIGSVAAAIGMSITLLARFAFFFGGSDDNRGGGSACCWRGSWRRSPRRSSRWPSRVRASTRPTSRAPTSPTIPRRWRARSASWRSPRSRSPRRPR